MAIRGYHQANGEHQRNVCLIPISAHGTNPASAQMAGMRVEPIRVKVSDGSIDIAHLKEKAEEFTNNLSCLMLTYPSVSHRSNVKNIPQKLTLFFCVDEWSF
jgi:glycine dehydrogenase